MSKKELVDFLLTKYNGGDLDYSNHEMDNSAICCKTIPNFIKYLNDNHFIYEGFTDSFNYRKDPDDLQRNIAMVFKDEDDNLFWIHSSTMYIHNWIYKELDNDFSKASEILSKFLDENNIKG